jgi:putative FmdB family regulatory protein
MPIYEYLCEKCGSHIEVIQKISDAPLKRCGKCRGKLEKTISRTSFQLKGSGWYATDHKSPSGESSRETKPEKAEKTEKAEKKPESKPAAEKKTSEKTE